MNESRENHKHAVMEKSPMTNEIPVLRSYVSVFQIFIVPPNAYCHQKSLDFCLVFGVSKSMPIIDYPMKTSVSNLIDITYDIYKYSPFFTPKRRGGIVVGKSFLLAYGRLGVRIPATTARP